MSARAELQTTTTHCRPSPQTNVNIVSKRLARAIDAAKPVSPRLAALAEFLLPRMPKMPLASQTIRSITRLRYSDPAPLEIALTLPWVAADSDEFRNVLAVDVDHASGLEDAEALARNYRLPSPTLVIDPWTLRCHAKWVLATPVLTAEGARQGPQILADLACRLLAAAMAGTPMPRKALLKSPWAKAENLIGRLAHHGPQPVDPVVWEVHETAASGLLWHTVPGDLRTVELREVLAALAEDFGEQVAASSTRIRFRRRRGQPDARGRNCTLFDLTRWWAYDRFETDASAIQAEAERVNSNFADPLPSSEVAGTARSIARFMVTRYRPRTGAGSTRGRDRQEGAYLDAPAKRALAGQQTAKGRATVTDEKISVGLSRLLSADQTLTQEALAASSGVSLRTVKSRWRQQGLVQDAVLSGSAAGARLLDRQQSSSLRSLCDIAEADRTERECRELIGQLSVLSALARRPGAVPQPLPAVNGRLATIQKVRVAVWAAEQAMADAYRRAANRQVRAEAQARALEMRRQALRGRDGWAWFRQQLADLDMVWDDVEADASERERPSLRMRRENLFGLRWRQWNAARREVRRQGHAGREARSVPLDLSATPL